jgi:hypothetical protein
MGRKGERHCIDKLIHVSGANHYDSDDLVISMLLWKAKAVI